MPQNDAGCRIEPPVSEPAAPKAMWAATAAAVGAASIVGAALLAVVYKRWRKSREAERTRAKLFEQYLQRARLQEEYDSKAKAS